MAVQKKIIILISVIMSVSMACGAEGEGGLPGAFVRIGAGSRALGMGKAFTALANDATAAYWNPSGLPLLNRTEIHSSYSALSMDRSNHFLAAALPFSNNSALSLSWLNFGDSNIIGRDMQGVVTESFSKSQNLFLLSYGRRITRKVSLGVSGKYFYNKLLNNQASGSGVDLGLMVMPLPMVRFGLVLQDIASYLNWDTDGKTVERLPFVTRFGCVYMPAGPALRLCADYEKIQDVSSIFHFGGELALSHAFQIRAGLDHENFTFGGSLLLPVEGVDLKMDYCFREDPIDNSTIHRFSLSVQLNQSKPRVHMNPEDELQSLFNEMASPLARIIRTTPQNPDYALINAGSDDGIYVGQVLDVYRELRVDNEKVNTLIGRAKVVRCKNEFSAVKAFDLQEGFQIERDDYVFME